MHLNFLKSSNIVRMALVVASCFVVDATATSLTAAVSNEEFRARMPEYLRASADEIPDIASQLNDWQLDRLASESEDWGQFVDRHLADIDTKLRELIRGGSSTAQQLRAYLCENQDSEFLDARLIEGLFDGEDCPLAEIVKQGDVETLKALVPVLRLRHSVELYSDALSTALMKYSSVDTMDALLYDGILTVEDVLRLAQKYHVELRQHSEFGQFIYDSMRMANLATHDVLKEHLQIGRPFSVNLPLRFRSGDLTKGTPLHGAVDDADPEFVRDLLAANANPNLIDGDGNTPLMKALLKGTLECVELLCQAGANVNVANRWGDTALTTAAKLTKRWHKSYIQEWNQWRMRWVDHDYASVVKRLLQAGARIDHRNAAGKTALIIAVEAGNDSVAALLVEYGADKSVKDDSGRTAADYLRARASANERLLARLER